MIQAYLQGALPMAHPDKPDEVGFFMSHEHPLIELDKLRIPSSAKRVIKSGEYELRINCAFPEVIVACARPEQPNQWLNATLARSYIALNQLGLAHSFEAWHDGQLAGGWFGVGLGTVLSADSSFHTRSGAGTFAMAAGLQALADMGYELVDAQMPSNLSSRFQTAQVDHETYAAMLKTSYDAFTKRMARAQQPVLQSHHELSQLQQDHRRHDLRDADSISR